MRAYLVISKNDFTVLQCQWTSKVKLLAACISSLEENAAWFQTCQVFSVSFIIFSSDHSHGFHLSLQMRGTNYKVNISAAEVGVAKTYLVWHLLSEKAAECSRKTFTERALPLCKHIAAEFRQHCLQRLEMNAILPPNLAGFCLIVWFF